VRVGAFGFEQAGEGRVHVALFKLNDAHEQIGPGARLRLGGRIGCGRIALGLRAAGFGLCGFVCGDCLGCDSVLGCRLSFFGSLSGFLTRFLFGCGRGLA